MWFWVRESDTINTAVCSSVWSGGRIQHTLTVYKNTKPCSLHSAWITLRSDQHSVDAGAQREAGTNPTAVISYRQICSE